MEVKKFKKSRTVVIAIFLSLFLSSLLMTTYTNKIVGYVANCTSWVDRIIGIPFSWINEGKENLSHLIKTYEENRILKERTYRLVDAESEVNALKEENQQLRELLNMKKLYEGNVQVTASVLNRVPANWSDDVIIDRGSNSQVTKQMLAIVNEGLVGTVERVEKDSSRVRLLTSQEKLTPVAVKMKVSTAEIFGILTGYDRKNNVFIISQLNSNEAIEKGSTVTTSGLGIYNISNIPVGKVVSVKENSNNFSREVFVRPAADMTNIHVLTLVRK